MKRLLKPLLRSPRNLLIRNSPNRHSESTMKNAISYDKHIMHIEDNRDIKSNSPVNRIFITCEHASNEYFNYLFF